MSYSPPPLRHPVPTHPVYIQDPPSAPASPDGYQRFSSSSDTTNSQPPYVPAYSSHFPAPPIPQPDFTAWGMNDATAQLGMQLGQSAVAAGQDYVQRNFGTIFPSTSLKHHFNVSNSYVINKIRIILFPWLQKPSAWRRQVVRSENGHTAVWDSPRDDINSPDLYIPSMALVTYILLCALYAGLSKQFHTKILGEAFSRGIAVLILDFAFVKLGCYFLNVHDSGSLVDIVAYGGYKFVGVIFVLIPSLLQLNTTLINTILFLYAFFANAFFLLRSLRSVFLPDASAQLVSNPNPTSTATVTPAARRRRVIFLFLEAILQFLYMALSPEMGIGATNLPNSPALSRFPWLTLGLGNKSTNASSDPLYHNDQDSDPMYIPYSGPVEPPKIPFRRRAERDSWGDLIEGENDDDDDDETEKSPSDFHNPAYSNHPFASGTLEQTKSYRPRTQLTVASVAQRPLPASGGVGESPMPALSQQRDTSNERNRSSIVSIFSFTGQTKKASKPLLRRLTKTGTSHRRSSSTGSNSLLGFTTRASDAAYHYTEQASSNDGQSTSNPAVPSHQGKPTSSSDTSPRHPYSYPFPSSSPNDGPHSAPLPDSIPTAFPSKQRVGIPAFILTEPQEKIHQASHPFTVRAVRGSTSTPDLRIGSPSNSPSRLHNNRASPKPKTKERWLSPETWCDALLFPRPRLKSKASNNDANVVHTVSLPPSPVDKNKSKRSALPRGVPERGVVSRVLAHSKSLVDLGKGPEDLFRAQDSSVHQTQVDVITSSKTRAPRPKSWALDDLALPTPVPSLSKVLEEGEQLECQRKQWQDQAVNSFQNKFTRSISRSRSKSLTQKGRKNQSARPSNIDFLAARACLGNQTLAPVVHYGHYNASLPYSSEPLNNASSPSQSAKESRFKTSGSLSRGHSRSESFGKAVLKKAKLVGRTRMDDEALDTDNKLESAIRGDNTKVIRLVDPALPRNPSPFTSDSPTPSGSVVSDANIGIALTTPPLVDSPPDVENVHMRSHPYAQGGMYSFSGGPARNETEPDLSTYMVASKSGHTPEPNKSPSPDSTRGVQDGLTSMSYHPYAQQFSSRSSYILEAKDPYSDVPEPSKIRAQLSPGVVRDVPSEDIQYLPFNSEHGDEPELNKYSRNSQVINDTVGVAEALAFAVKDNGLVANRGQADGNAHRLASTSAPKRIYRQPVQYNAARPPHLLLPQRKVLEPYSAHTFASSPLLHQQQSPRPLNPDDHQFQMEPTSVSPPILSPSQSPHFFSGPDDLTGFYDLFYDPNHRALQKITTSSSTSGSEIRVESHRRTESGLTSLTRQLNEEIEQLALEQRENQNSRSSMTDSQISEALKNAGSPLRFIFEETSLPGSPGQHMISPFQPSSNFIPEDVESSSRASSPLEAEQDERALLRVGVVGSVSTPPLVDGDHRVSFTGQMSSPINERTKPAEGQDITSKPRTNSGLQPPSADPTRSSYITTSSMSRMSGLSDFPVPPQPDTAEHMSLISSYYEESYSRGTFNAPSSLIPTFDDTLMVHSDEHRHPRYTTASGVEEMDELVAALSSHSHSTVRH
ncbi:hypothetical protein H0H93_001163 [Arthromyces matolae]|nr:hypothetical protein H0H93_001163 [Arthromyces matolae]